MIHNRNIPGNHSGLARAGHKHAFSAGGPGTHEKIASGHLVSPIAFSREDRKLKRISKPLDRKIGHKRSMGK